MKYLISITNFQGVGELSRRLHWGCTIQNSIIFYLVPDNLLASVLWHNMDPNSWCPFPIVNYASCPSSAVFAAQVFQRCPSSRFGCYWIWRSSCYCLQLDIWSKYSTICSFQLILFQIRFDFFFLSFVKWEQIGFNLHCLLYCAFE